VTEKNGEFKKNKCSGKVDPKDSRLPGGWVNKKNRKEKRGEVLLPGFEARARPQRSGESGLGGGKKGMLPTKEKEAYTFFLQNKPRENKDKRAVRGRKRGGYKAKNTDLPPSAIWKTGTGPALPVCPWTGSVGPRAAAVGAFKEDAKHARPKWRPDKRNEKGLGQLGVSSRSAAPGIAGRLGLN